MESSDRDLAIVEKVLCEDVPVPLVDVTRPHDTDVGTISFQSDGVPADPVKFSEKLQALRPGRSVDRHRWRLRGGQLMGQHGYKDVCQLHASITIGL